MEISNENLNIESEIEKLSINKTNQFNNFYKKKFIFNKIDFELGVSIYSNMLFIILTSNGKLGSFWLGEIENRDLIDPLENIYDIQCLLGNRKDEANQFLCSNINSYIFTQITKENSDNKFSKISKIMISTSLSFSQLFNLSENNENDEILMKKEFKDFINLVKNQIGELLYLK